MANIKSAKKRAKQAEVKRQRNLARKTALKTAIKKVLVSLERGDDLATTRELLQQAESKIAQARGKGLLHAGTASRKISRLAKKVSTTTKRSKK